MQKSLDTIWLLDYRVSSTHSMYKDEALRYYLARVNCKTTNFEDILYIRISYIKW